MSTKTTSSELLVDRKGATVLVTLNRPEVLNSLSLNMIRELSKNLDLWSDDNSVSDVVISGAGGKAFCAGGDIKASYYLRDEKILLFDYFAEEYRMNRKLFHFKKPMAALIDGITMGGGFGVAGACPVRVATEKTKWAMPETGIGFFPDVGSGYFLNRCPGEVGTFLAVTGMMIGPDDAFYGGLATSYDGADVTRGVLYKNRTIIDRCFSAGTVEKIMERLEQSGDAWALDVLSLMKTRSPLSMKVSLERMRRAKGQSFDVVIDEDYVIAQHFVEGDEFFEGVRAMLIDKDRKPLWQPSTLQEVTQTMVAQYFVPTGRVL